jgi:hypothetical protein
LRATPFLFVWARHPLAWALGIWERRVGRAIRILGEEWVEPLHGVSIGCTPLSGLVASSLLFALPQGLIAFLNTSCRRSGFFAVAAALGTRTT